MDSTGGNFASALLANSEICKSLLDLQTQCETKDASGFETNGESAESLQLSIGDTVQLHGLTSRNDLNGCSAVIVRENDDKSRWIVRLETLDLEMALKPANLQKHEQVEKLREGDIVSVHGLSGSPEFNGCEGAILREDVSRGRWIVQLRGSEKELALQRTNLQKCSSFPSIWSCSEGGTEALRVVGRARLPFECERGFGVVVEIAFRGSQNIQNWMTNFTASLQDLDVGVSSGRVHKGFSEAFASIRQPMLANITESLAQDKTEPILAYVVGHSLGGALATIAAYHLAASFGYTVRCVTWGSPRVGDADFARAYMSAVPATVRFVNASDVVPRVPVNPADPNDDGAVMGEKISQWLHMIHAKVDAHEYVHVCSGTSLRDTSIAGGNALNRALDGFNACFEQGVGIGAQSLFKSHYMTSYVKTTNSFLDDGSGYQAQDVPVVNAAETAEKAGKAVLNIFAGATKAYAAFKRHQDDSKAS